MLLFLERIYMEKRVPSTYYTTYKLFQQVNLTIRQKKTMILLTMDLLSIVTAQVIITDYIFLFIFLSERLCYRQTKLIIKHMMIPRNTTRAGPKRLERIKARDKNKSSCMLGELVLHK